MKWRENMAMKALAFMAAGGGGGAPPRTDRWRMGPLGAPGGPAELAPPRG